jgi:hypothetical protein
MPRAPQDHRSVRPLAAGRLAGAAFRKPTAILDAISPAGSHISREAVSWSPELCNSNVFHKQNS